MKPETIRDLIVYKSQSLPTEVERGENLVAELPAFKEHIIFGR